MAGIYVGWRDTDGGCMARTSTPASNRAKEKRRRERDRGRKGRNSRRSEYKTRYLVSAFSEVCVSDITQRARKDISVRTFSGKTHRTRS